MCEESTARMVSGDIVLNLESDDAEQVVQVTQPMLDAGKGPLKERQAQIKRRHCQLKAKGLAERCLCLVLYERRCTLYPRTIVILVYN